MPLSAFLLVITAAFLHASWNFVAKKTAGNFNVIYVSLVIAGCIFFGISSWFWPYHILDLQVVLPYLLGTSTCMFAYITLLMKAYQNTDISLAYPVSRGTGILGTTFVAFYFLSQPLSAWGFVGIMALLLGITLLTLKKSAKHAHYKSILLAILTGVTISGYSLFDSYGVTLVHPLIFITWKTLFSVFLISPFLLHKKKKRDAIITDIRKYWKELLFILFAANIGYLMMLFAYQMAPVSYLVALRETSVAMGAILGFYLLKEQVTTGKILGIGAIVAGAILIKIYS